MQQNKKGKLYEIILKTRFSWKSHEMTKILSRNKRIWQVGTLKHPRFPIIFPWSSSMRQFRGGKNLTNTQKNHVKMNLYSFQFHCGSLKRLVVNNTGPDSRTCRIEDWTLYKELKFMSKTLLCIYKYFWLELLIL